MTDNLHNRTFRIVSLSEANLPIGVNHTKPTYQNVHINAPVHNWKFEKVGDHRYKLSIHGYPYTGVHEGRVIASTEREHEAEWDIVRHEYQNAFTIALARERHLGWTVPHHSAGFHEIEVKPIIATPSFPPHFLPVQLFALEESEAR